MGGGNGEMELSVSPYVDHSGLVELPCLTDWAHEVTDLCTLLQIARVTFSETPPVFARPRQDRARRKVSKDEFESVWDEHFPDEEEKMLKSFFLTSASETCRTKLGEEYSRTRAEVDSLHSVNKELIDRQEEVDKLRLRMTSLDVDATADVATLIKAKDTLAMLQEARTTSRPVTVDTVEELVKVPNPAHRQLLEALAEDEAIKDTVYALGQALKNDQISTDVYLKKVRELSRKQFNCRLMVNTVTSRQEETAARKSSLTKQQSLP